MSMVKRNMPPYSVGDFEPNPCVCVDDESEGTAILPLRGGYAELGEAVYLQGTGLDLWHTLEETGSPKALVDRLMTRGAAGPEQATRDVDSFLRALEASSLIRYTPPTYKNALEEPEIVAQQPCGSDTPEEPRGERRPSTLRSLKEIEHLVREVLTRSIPLQFRAHGRSMRPWIPDGSTLIIDPVSWDSVRKGDIAFFATEEHRLVAHRVIAKKKGHFLARGDSCPRIDRVSPDAFLGRVRALRTDGRLRPMDRGWRRPVGSWANRLYALAHRIGSRIWRSLFTPILGALVRRPGPWDFPLRVLSSGYCRLERHCRRAQRTLGGLRAALLPPDTKDRRRRELYARHSIQEFTSLDENIEKGLTLIEEVIFSRHDLPPGPTLILGCGPGRESMALARRGFEVVGLDREQGMLRKAVRLAQLNGLDIDYRQGEAVSFDLEERFDYVVVFSGLYNMILPREERLRLLRCARRHLAPGGRVLMTFLSEYVDPRRPKIPARSRLESIAPYHRRGDRFLLNEVVHIFPHEDLLREEAKEGGFLVEELFRDQRAYDRFGGSVRGYTILRST